MKKQTTFSIIIPVRIETNYLKETLSKLSQQSYKEFEVLVITDKISKKYDKSPNHLGPSYKRNLGAKLAKGKYLAFIDDDSYPHADWLKNALVQLESQKHLAAVCGPCLTPPHDNIFQKASGLVWSSWLGSGGAGTYRNSIQKERYVDDYPTVNLIVSKDVFDRVGGFNNDYWPGEDTILCLEITHKLKRKILYHPSVIVYHHRRNIVVPHLQQITRYAIHRGHFSKAFPETSFRVGYLIPSFFFLYIVTLLPVSLLFSLRHPLVNFYYLPFTIYSILLFLNFIHLYIKTGNLLLTFLASTAIPLTHLYYGFLFLIGLLKPKLNFEPHQINQSKNSYLGG